MSPRMGEELALALALEGRVEAVRGETAQLVALAETLSSLPEPQIDETWAAALEARLLTDGLSEPTPVVRPTLTVVPAPQKKQTTTEPVRRAAVVTLPKRRMVVRRSIAAVAAAAALGAFPLVAAASSLPGSPFYGLKLRIERIELTMFGGPVADGMKMLEFSGRRISEAHQVEILGGDPDVVAGLLAEAQRLLDEGSRLVLDNTTDTQALLDLAAAAVGLEQQAREMAPGLSGDSREQAQLTIALSQEIQDLVDAALGANDAELGVPVTAPELSAGSASAPIAASSSSDLGSGGTVAAKDPSGGGNGGSGGSGGSGGGGNGKGSIGDPENPGCPIIGSEGQVNTGDALAFTTKVWCGDAVRIPVPVVEASDV